MLPIHADEMDLKLEKGADELADLFDKAQLSEVLEPGRTSVAPRRRRLFRR